MVIKRILIWKVRKDTLGSTFFFQKWKPLGQECLPSFQVETDFIFWNQSGDNWEGLKKRPFKDQMGMIWLEH